MVEFLRMFWFYGAWMIPIFVSAFCLYRFMTRFLTVKEKFGWKALLFVVLGGSTGMIIWIGDNNLLFTLPVFLAAGMLCSRGDWMGRLTVTMIFFCMIMSVSAMIDSYLDQWDVLYDVGSRILRPVIWAAVYAILRCRLPEEAVELPRRLWKLVLALAAMPMCSLMTVVLASSYWRYSYEMVDVLSRNMGLVILPMVCLTSVVLLFAICILADHEALERSQQLAGLRETYYQGLRREQEQVRGLRHDLRNHLTALDAYLERGDLDKAQGYLQQIVDSPAMQGTIRFCENETANAVLSSKALIMKQLGLTADFVVQLPAELPIADPDLCVLLGSALDNAIEAAAAATQKTILLRASGEKGLFMLRCRNAYAGERRTTEKGYETTKPDRAVHGFGLRHMNQISQRMGGTLEATAEAGIFELIICIPLDKGNRGPRA